MESVRSDSTYSIQGQRYERRDTHTADHAPMDEIFAALAG